MIKPLLMTSGLILAAVTVFAAPAVKTKTVKPAAAVKSAPLICPVTGEKIASIKDAVGHSVYQGKTYYFCCSGCKPLFDKNPGKYIKSASDSKSVKPSAAKS